MGALRKSNKTQTLAFEVQTRITIVREEKHGDAHLFTCACAVCSHETNRKPSTHLFQGRLPDSRREASLFARDISDASSSEVAKPWKDSICDRSRDSLLGPIGMCAPRRIPCFFETSTAALKTDTDVRVLRKAM